jgi:pyroglutamyl-peptidase
MIETSKSILLTGFEPFDRFALNPSGLVAQGLDGCLFDKGYVVHGAVLPVDCQKMAPELNRLVAQFRPQVVIGLGLAFGDSGLRIERVGHNWSQISTPDNGGHTRPGSPLLADAPAAYFSTFPASQIIADLLEAGIPVYPSDHAGGHLCNQMLFTALHAINSGAWQTAQGEVRLTCGFIHLPATPQLVARLIQTDKNTRNGPSMALELMQRGVELALKCTMTHLASR